MPDKNEIISIDLSSEGKLRLYSHVTAQMERLGYNPMDYGSLHLGFELPAGWMVDIKCEVTLAQLTVLAVKLKMQITISDLNIFERKES